jgi:putative transcriptional regulator
VETPPPVSTPETPRLIDALLAGYAAGALEPYLHALIESHLILSGENRSFVRSLEAAAGEELDSIDASPPVRPARDHVLAAIYADGWYGRPRPPKLDPDMPAPLARLVGSRLDDVKWKLVAPGVREHVLHDGDGVQASLIKLKPGCAIPSHTHEGLEATLVLRGAFSDSSGRYRRGDAAVADAAVDHRPVADRGGDCICYSVSDAPFRLTGPVGRIVERLFRS